MLTLGVAWKKARFKFLKLGFIILLSALKCEMQRSMKRVLDSVGPLVRSQYVWRDLLDLPYDVGYKVTAMFKRGPAFPELNSRIELERPLTSSERQWLRNRVDAIFANDDYFTFSIFDDRPYIFEPNCMMEDLEKVFKSAKRQISTRCEDSDDKEKDQRKLEDLLNRVKFLHKRIAHLCQTHIKLMEIMIAFVELADGGFSSDDEANDDKKDKKTVPNAGIDLEGVESTADDRADDNALLTGLFG